jgi:hypothetical protein
MPITIEALPDGGKIENLKLRQLVSSRWGRRGVVAIQRRRSRGNSVYWRNHGPFEGARVFAGVQLALQEPRLKPIPADPIRLRNPDQLRRTGSAHCRQGVNIARRPGVNLRRRLTGKKE